MEPGHPFSLLGLAPRTRFEPSVQYHLFVGSLYPSLHLLFVKFYSSLKSAAIIHFSRIRNAGIVPRTALFIATFPATSFFFAQAETVIIFEADNKVMRLCSDSISKLVKISVKSSNLPVTRYESKAG